VEPLKRAILLLRRVLAVQPDRVNTLLKEAARDTPLRALVRAWTRAHGDLAAQKLDPQILGRFREGLEALDGLEHNLSDLVTDHDQWQNLDVILGRIEGNMRQNVAELEESWPYLIIQSRALCTNNSSKWATRFRKAVDDLDRAIAQGDTAKIKRVFRSYHRQAGIRFHQVDKDLKGLCDDMVIIGTELAAKVGMIHE
jgi:hypothetical protein